MNNNPLINQILYHEFCKYHESQEPIIVTFKDKTKLNLMCRVDNVWADRVNLRAKDNYDAFYSYNINTIKEVKYWKKIVTKKWWMCCL